MANSLSIPEDYEHFLRELKERIRNAQIRATVSILHFEFVQQVVAQISWGHNVRILDTIKDNNEREWYIRQTIEQGWFLTGNKSGGKFRKRRGETLFIDGRKLGFLIDRVHRDLTEEEIKRIAQTYHHWRGSGQGKYEDVPGFCKSASFEEIKGHGYVLTPGRYVGAEEVEDDDEPFEEKMERLTRKLEEQFSKSAELEREIRANLRGLGYE